MIVEPANSSSVSLACLWKIAIKYALGRRDMPVSSGDALASFREAGYSLLDIEPEHAIAFGSLLPVNQVPFDRLLLAQARTEPSHLVTADAVVGQYGDWVIRV